MKKHDFLNLKMGIIEQYAMIVKKTDLDYWKKLGWLTYVEIGLPKSDEQSFMLYGEIKKNEMLIFNKPVLMRDLPKKKLIGRQVTGVSTRLGTYGMGGPGFFGLLLDSLEFLTYAVWGAGSYVLIDDRVVECTSNLYKKVRPWMSHYDEENNWDDLTDHIVGSTITSFSFTHETCLLKLKKKNKTIEVLFVKNDIRLPRTVGRKRNAYKKGEISDYVLLQHKDGVLIV